MRATITICLGLAWMPAYAGGDDAGRAETLFAKVRGAEPATRSPSWKEFLAHPSAAEVARKHLADAAEADRGVAAAITALASLEGEKAADDCARLALEGRSERVRAAGRSALKGLPGEMPDRVLLALKGRRELALRALDLVKDRPDEKGLYGIIVAVDEVGYGGGGPSGYVFGGEQRAYVGDYTAVVQQGAVAYDPEVAYVSTATAFQAKVLSVTEYRRSFHEITGVKFPTPGKASAWWAEHKDEVLRRMAEKQGKAAAGP